MMSHDEYWRAFWAWLLGSVFLWTWAIGTYITGEALDKSNRWKKDEHPFFYGSVFYSALAGAIVFTAIFIYGATNGNFPHAQK